jgi:hypothetical protein
MARPNLDTLDRAGLEKELAEITAKLNARNGVPGFSENCEAIRARIAAVQAKIDGLPA